MCAIHEGHGARLVVQGVEAQAAGAARRPQPLGEQVAVEVGARLCARRQACQFDFLRTDAFLGSRCVCKRVHAADSQAGWHLRWVVPLPRVAAAKAEEVQEQQKPWLANTLLPLASVAQPHVGLVLRPPASHVFSARFAPVRMTACACKQPGWHVALMVGHAPSNVAHSLRLHHLGGLPVVGLLVRQRVCRKDGALGDGDVDGVCQVAALTIRIRQIIAGAWAPPAATA